MWGLEMIVHSLETNFSVAANTNTIRYQYWNVLDWFSQLGSIYLFVQTWTCQ